MCEHCSKQLRKKLVIIVNSFCDSANNGTGPDETGPDEGPQQKHKNQTTNHLEISIAPL